MDMKVFPCNLCGSQHLTVLASSDRDKSPLTTVICEECGLVFTNPRPSDSDIENFYAKEYRLNYKGTYQPKLKHIHRAARIALGRYARLASDYQGAKHVLDIGAGGGEYCYLLKGKGLQAEGIEPNEGYAEFAKNRYHLTMHIGSLDTHRTLEPIYDVISLFHVFEHFCDPKKELKIMKSLCKPDGKIIIEVPDMEATEQHPQHKFHLAHLFNFNLTTLMAMGESVGLGVHRSFTSDDKCSITVVFENCPPKAKTITLTENATRIKRIYRQHTALRYYLSNSPYARLGDKIIAYSREYLVAKRIPDGKVLIDSLYKQAVNT